MWYEIKIRVVGFGVEFEEHHISDGHGGHVEWEHYGSMAHIGGLKASTAVQGAALLQAAITEAAAHPETKSFTVNVDADDWSCGEDNWKNG